jgi:hypothetical protein
MHWAQDNDVVDEQIGKIPATKDTRQDFLVMTIGGNDIEFSKLVIYAY